MNVFSGKATQRGLSLVELLISVTIGIFLLGALVTNFISTKESDRSRAVLSEMDADAASAIQIMRQTIRHTGYPSVYNVTLDKAFYTPSDPALVNPLCRNGALKRDITDSATPGNDQKTRDRWRGDVITVISMADNPCQPGQLNCANLAAVNTDAPMYVDCMGGGSLRGNRTVACSADPIVGMPNQRDAKIYSTFRLGGGNNSRTLYCDGSRGGSQPLVGNVEAMQILYGVKQDNGMAIYRDATAVDAANDWGLVKSVQVALLMRSSKHDVLKQDNPKTQYILLDKSWTIAEEDYRRLFRVYTTTIHLANQ